MSDKNATVVFKGLTFKQAKVLSDWYEGQGEQDAGAWFEENRCETPMPDVTRLGGYREIDKANNTVTIYCK